MLSQIHPGEHVAEELKTLNISAAELARRINVPPRRVFQIIKGTRPIARDTALRLANYLGTTAQFWLNLQTLYDLRVSQQRIGKNDH